MNRAIRGAAVLILAAVMVGAGCGDRARTLRERAARTCAGLTDYEVTTEIISGGARSDRMVVRQAARAPASYRLDALAPDDIKGQTTIRNGRALWVYDPAARELIISGIGPASYDSNSRIILRDIMMRFAAAADARFLRSERGPDGTLAVVEYADPTSEQGSVRLWADAKTGAPARVEYLYRDGTVSQAVIFRDLRLNPGLPLDRFNFAVPAGTRVIEDDNATRSVSLEEARRIADFRLLLPEELPAGFALTDVSIAGAGDDLLIILSYTAGERLIQLTEAKYAGGDDSISPGSVRRIVNGTEYRVEAADGFATIAWTRDGVSLSLTADLKLEELFGLAQAVK